jgi:hypothetical protein
VGTTSARQQAKAIDPDRVAIYIRWSTDDQGDGTTLDVQMEGCRHYALSQGWNVTEDLIFIDDGYSGGSLDRPANPGLVVHFLCALAEVLKVGALPLCRGCRRISQPQWLPPAVWALVLA